MRKKVIFFFFGMVCSFSALAGEGEYAVANISPALLKNADAVLRLEEIKFEIFSTTHTEEINHYVITILNENGDFWADLREQYDKLRHINSIEGVLYDALGKATKHLKNKDLVDISGTSGNDLADDDRVKKHNFYCKVYPYTVEYTIKTEYNNTLFFPGWIPQGRQRLSVERSTYRIFCPTDYKFRYKSFNYNGEPVKAQEKNVVSTSWSVKDMPAIEREVYAPRWHELTTMVIAGPTNFQIEDYKGNMQNWNDFGKFTYALKNGRDQLPENIKQTVHQIADGIGDSREKITRLYEYMQKNTRYISIQLGIGGWQPFDAKYVATKGYGDCKALTNYMYSILKEAGITSYYSLIKAGRNAGYITDDFPSSQFNHVILCVPLQKDTIWLECTDQSLPAGYLSGFTSDRFALLVKEEGSTLVRTPKYGIKENIQIRKIKADLDEQSELQFHSVTSYQAMQQDELQMTINNFPRDKLKELLHEEFDFATYDISNFEYKENKSSHPSIDETLDIAVSNYATITGKRLFILPNVMTRSHLKLPVDSTRKFDLDLSDEYQEVDTVEINLPAGYTTESLPQDVSVNSKFGKYNCSVRLSGNQLKYYRSIEHYAGRFPAKDYAELVKFYETIYKSDRNKVVLVKNQ